MYHTICYQPPMSNIVPTYHKRCYVTISYGRVSFVMSWLVALLHNMVCWGMLWHVASYTTYNITYVRQSGRQREEEFRMHIDLQLCKLCLLSPRSRLASSRPLRFSRPTYFPTWSSMAAPHVHADDIGLQDSTTSKSQSDDWEVILNTHYNLRFEN